MEQIRFAGKRIHRSKSNLYDPDDSEENMDCAACKRKFQIIDHQTFIALKITSSIAMVLEAYSWKDSKFHTRLSREREVCVNCLDRQTCEVVSGYILQWTH